MLYKNVLTVFSKQDEPLRLRIEEDALEELLDAKGRRVVVHSARHVRDARDKVDQLKDLHFVVVGHRLAANGKSIVDELAGLALCAELRAGGATMPIVLVVPYVNAKTNELMVRAQELAITVFHDGPDVAALIREQVVSYSPPPRTLDVTLRLSADSLWKYELVGNRFHFYRRGDVAIDGSKLDMARSLSKAIGETQSDEWYGFFESLGRSLTDTLCQAPAFNDDLQAGIELAGGIERARISFSLGQVDRKHYPIALEALFPPQKYTAVPWMVRAPLYRKVHAGHGLVDSLFGPNQRPLKVLLVSADADGYVDELAGANGRALRLDELLSVERECKGLERYFRCRQQEGRVRELSVLRRDGDGRITKRALLDALETEDWNVVHFAGHSVSREDGDKESRGWLFVGRPGSPEAVGIDEIAPYLRRTTMVYLSCCESNSPAFAVELARHGVPIVIGYRWRVDDRFAALHAHLFYRHLFKERRVENAFLQTRRSIHRHFSRRDRVWASSMLVFGATP
jgi:hypothetical protein